MFEWLQNEKMNTDQPQADCNMCGHQAWGGCDLWLEISRVKGEGHMRNWREVQHAHHTVILVDLCWWTNFGV